MELHIVGGAVRDKLLGIKPKDIDYLVSSSTVDEFIKHFPTAKKVGRDFPVFLVDGDEYAFARVERKTGSGHKDFTTEHRNISVIEDLKRRDLTINSIAMSLDGNKFTCVENAMDDIQNKILRHTGDAFKEDPLRVFRVARFAAQLDGFSVAEETMTLLSSMSDDLKHLSPERVFLELKKALESDSPRRFFEVLRDSNCLNFWFPEVARLVNVKAGPDKGKHKGEKDTFEHTMNVLSGIPNDPVLRFAGLCHDLGKSLSENPPHHPKHDKDGIELVLSLCERIKAPKIYKKSAVLFCSQHIRMHKIEEMNSGKACRLIIQIVNGMHYGLYGFLLCSIGDFMGIEQARRIMLRADKMLQVRLPEKYRGRGKVCGDILLQGQCKEWKDSA